MNLPGNYSAGVSKGPARPLGGARGVPALLLHSDRKSTRLNSSHMSSSYAVFCLKKKTVSRSREGAVTNLGCDLCNTHVNDKRSIPDEGSMLMIAIKYQHDTSQRDSAAHHVDQLH